MSDFVVAMGLVLVVEGLLFAALPGLTKRAMANALETPDGLLRVVGVASALLGLVVVWLIRG